MNKEKYIDNILLENDRLYKENKELHNKIDKAIELIKNKTKIIPLEDGGGLELCDYDIQNLLKILKVSDVDDNG